MRAQAAGIMMALLSAPALAAPASPSAAAQTWLGLIDHGRYAQSWDEAGALFRAQITGRRWAGMVAGVRGPLGAVVSRRLIGETHATTAPGAPDGRYATLQFSTSFTHKSQATETVTMADGAAGWRVVGYFIR